MSQHNKQLTHKQKLIMCILAVVLAATAAIISVILLVHTVENPPAVIVNSSETSYISVIGFDQQLSSLDSEPVSVDENNNVSLINGVKDNSVYYTTQYIRIGGNKLKSITVNGGKGEKAFFIDGNETNKYVIEVTDADKNVTTCTIYTRPISTLLEPISHLNEYTVTSDDCDTINAVQSSLFEIETTHATLKESQTINDAVNICEKLLKKIEAVASEITTVTDSVNQCEESKDYTNIHNLINDIDALLASENLTKEQRSDLNKMNSKCLSWMASSTQDEPIEEIIE